jgi:hypothetical protein
MYNLVAFKHYVLRVPNRDVWFQSIGNLDRVTHFQISAGWVLFAFLSVCN